MAIKQLENPYMEDMQDIEDLQLSKRDEEEIMEKLALNQFNGLDFHVRGKYNLCDYCSCLMFYTEGEWQKTFIRGVRGSSRWICRKCEYVCPKCGVQAHPRNRERCGCGEPRLGKVTFGAGIPFSLEGARLE